LKKQVKHNVEQFFRENITQYFPTDPALWQQADKRLIRLFLRKKIIYYAASVLLLGAAVIGFLMINYTPKVTTITKMDKLNNSSIQSIQMKGNETIEATPSIEMETANKSGKNSKVKTASSLAHKQSEISQTTVTNDPKVIGKTFKSLDSETEMNFKEISNPENGTSKKDEEILQVEFNSNPSDPIAKLSFETPAYSRKLIKPFLYSSTSSKPVSLPELKNPERRFAVFVEFENLLSTSTSLRLNKLSEKELVYRNRSESIQNSSAYALNLIIQKKGFGLVTGISQQSASLKTNYLRDYFTYDFETKYKMLKDSISYKRGYYSQILEYNDTTASYAEQQSVDNQSSETTLKWLSIPIKFSYQYPIQRLRFSVRAGADFSWLYASKGSLINSKLEQVIAINQGEQTLNKFNVNASLAFLAGYQLNKQIQIGGSVFTNRQLGSNFANYTSKFRNQGMGWFVRYSF